MKVDRGALGVTCFVAKLNRSNAAVPQVVLGDKGTVSIIVNTNNKKKNNYINKNNNGFRAKRDK